MVTAFRKNISILITLLFTGGLVGGEECGQEELARCSRPLQVLSDTSELSFVTKKEELDKLCPDLYKGLSCIQSYTVRCMSTHQRTHFNRLYAGTSSLIKELCREGAYQLEFLRHAPCMRSVRQEYETCAREHQRTMASLTATTNNDTEEDPEIQHLQQIRTICCSFQDYMECSEQTVQRTCGNETAAFTRSFLDKMASSLIRMHCSDYSSGSRACALSGSATAAPRAASFLTAAGVASFVALRSLVAT